MKKQTLVYIYIFTGFLINAQEKLGIANSNYSSTNSIFLNPSSSVDSRAYLQLNLAGLNVYAMNNLGYIPKFSIWDLKRTGQIQPFQVSSLNLKKFLLAVASVEGPAFVISKRNYGAGFFVRARSVGEIKGVPFALSNFLLNPDTTQKLNYPVNIDLKNIRFSNMSWVEYGVNFGIMIRKQKLHMLSIGGNLKYLTGLNIAYGNLQQLQGDIEPTAINVDQLKGKLRFNQFGWATGKGVGIDFGLTYKKMLDGVDRYYANSPLSNCKYVDYKYKLGVSLRDLGFIRFKKNTTTSDINASGHFNTDTSKNNINYKADLQNNFNAGLLHDPILACLPTALSVQLDWNFGNNFYLNGTVVKNMVPNSFVGVQGSNLISVSPRYEIKNFEVAMPLTFQKFIYPQLGFAFRVRTFVLGFDNVFPLIIKKNTYGLNVYFSIGISIFRNQACRKHPRKVDNCPPNSFFKRNKKGKTKVKSAKTKSFSKPKKIRT